jgi:hypothetical protein
VYIVRACVHTPTCKGMTYLANFLLWIALLSLSTWFVICKRRDFLITTIFRITCFVMANEMAIWIRWFGYYSLWMLITNVQHHIPLSMSTNLVWYGMRINNRRMPWVMLNYGPNGCRRIGRPLKRLLGIWHSEDRASWYILIIKPTKCTNPSNLFLE